MTHSKRFLGVLLVLVLSSGVAAVGAKPTVSEETARVQVRADFVGPADIEFPEGGPRGVTYALLPDGSSVTLWADSVDNLDEGVTAMWYGDQVDVTAAETYVKATLGGTLGGEAMSSAPIVCTVWADPPYYDNTWETVEATGYHWCSGPWSRHRLVGRLQQRWNLIFWLTEDTDDTYWEYVDAKISVSPTVDCQNSDSVTWRHRATGTVQGNGSSSTRSHNSSRITVGCGV